MTEPKSRRSWGLRIDGSKMEAGEGMKRPPWWTSEEGRLKAINMFNQLQIGTVDYIEKRTARINQNKEDRLKGF